MAKEIDKIIQSKTAPNSNNVLWDDGENLKINRNGRWENTNKGGSSNQELFAYPVEIYEGPQPKVVELGGEKLYNYLGEISIPSGMEEISGTFLDTMPTDYYYQESYEGALKELFGYEHGPDINLYVGNDKYGYTSLRIEPSEYSNNLKWFYAFGLGMWQEGPGSISFAYDAKNLTVHYKANSYVPCNIKVYWLYKAQKLDVNLIPQEIARKEDIATEASKEIDNHEYPTVTVDADTKTYSGKLGSKTIKIDINLSEIHLGRNNLLNLVNEFSGLYQYKNSNIMIVFKGANNNIFDIYINKPAFVINESNLDWCDYRNADFNNGECFVVTSDESLYSATIDSDDFVTTLINGKYFKYKLNRETHLLELQSEIDLNSIESRLAALEAK